jgi:large subunit ribosomal protein L4
MATVKLYSSKGEVVGDIALPDEVFGITPNEAVVHEVVKAHLAAKRQGTQSSLTRAEVSGGGKKPYRQKGTGNARQGSTRSPQWTHGGIVFAPKPRSYTFAVNKKVKRLALRSALSDKVLSEAIYVIDGLAQDEIKTKTFTEFLGKLGIAGKAYIVTDGVQENVYKSARNIKGATVTTDGAVSVYDVLKAKALVIDKTAAEKIAEVLK